MSKLNILVTNDDGIHFAGIDALRKSLRKIANVYTFAPSKERSGTSQALTIFDDVHVKKLNNYDFIVDGFPVDCVNIGLHGGLTDVKYDMVISGINKGVNMGDDVYYSGTVGGARHGFIHHLPAIAVSSGYIDENGDYDQVGDFLCDLIQFCRMETRYFANPYLLNVNYPVLKKVPLGIKWTKLGKRIYRDSYKKTPIAENEFFFNLGGSILGYKEAAGTDFEAFNNDYISITPLTLDATDYTQLEQFQKRPFVNRLGDLSFI